MTDEGPEREPPRLDDEERARYVARVFRWIQAGGIAFLAVLVLGMMPRLLAWAFPGIGDAAAGPVMLAALAVPLVLLVVAAIRLRR